MSLRAGSRIGLRLVAKCEGRPDLTLQQVAREHSMHQTKAQTCLCIYGKYHRYFHDGIGRWYLEPPPCFSRGHA
eukprot:3683914-Pyramimonas_sp.AAC.1